MYKTPVSTVNQIKKLWLTQNPNRLLCLLIDIVIHQYNDSNNSICIIIHHKYFFIAYNYRQILFAVCFTSK